MDMPQCPCSYVQAGVCMSLHERGTTHEDLRMLAQALLHAGSHTEAKSNRAFCRPATIPLTVFVDLEAFRNACANLAALTSCIR